MVNLAIVVGNLGQDPELRTTDGGTAVCNFSVATNRVWYNKDKEKQEEVAWHNIVVWGRQAENCKEYLSKGRKVYIRGRMQTRSWEDKEGVKRYRSEIVAEDVKFLGGKEDSGSGGSTGRRDAPPPLDDSDIPF